MAFKIYASLLYLIFAIIMMTISQFGVEMYFNNLGSLFLLSLMLLDIRKDVLSRSGYIGLVIFSFFHSFGACWLYSYVPYNEWFISIFDFDFDQYFNLSRNHYDRLVHFLFGLLFVPTIRDLFLKYNFNYKMLLFVTFLSIQTFSMLYELFEWGIAVFLSEDMAESYNGQQGDIWDAHKDMALAMLGSLISIFYIKNEPSKN